MTGSVRNMLLRAQAHERTGEIDIARSLYRTVLQDFPGNMRAKRALARLEARRQRAADADPPREVVDSLVALFRQKQFPTLAEQTQHLVQQFATSAFLWNLLGVSSAQIGDLAEAETAFHRASVLRPDYAEAHNNLGNVLRDDGKIAEAVTSFRRALTIAPDFAEAHNNLGNALKAAGDPDAAMASYRRALTLRPTYVEAQINLGSLLHAQGRLAEAVASYRQAITIAPDHAVAHNSLGNALSEQGKLDEALASYSRALAIAPGNALAHNNLGNALSGQGQFAAAEASYRRAIEIRPDYAECHRHLSELTTYSAGDPQIETMLRLHQAPDTPPQDRCHICFALAKAFEDTGDLAQAFGYLTEGNALRKGLLHYDIGQDRRLFAAIRRSEDAVRSLAIAPAQASATIPIFILGMPRSGTSLVEQIISSHSAVQGAGELTAVERLSRSLIVGETPLSAESLRAFRTGYLDDLAAVSGGKTFVTDKTPHNFRFIGLIARALPEARIIHVSRDAKAVCWSNFRQYFTADGIGYSHDLGDIVSYYRLYSDLMQHWAARYPDRIYELNYESLTEHQADETKALIAHLGLPWQEACLSPHKNPRAVTTASQLQVRRAVYTGSSSAWKRYAPFIGAALADL